MRLLSLSLFLVFAAISLPLHAADVSVPHQFASGQKAVAADVNANFEALVTALNTALARINDLEAKVATIESNKALELDEYVEVLSGPEVHGYTTVRFRGVNLQVVDGTGATVKSPGNENGLGNLIVGYNEAGGIEMCDSPGPLTRQDFCEDNDYVWQDTYKTGAHNLVVGSLHNYAGSAGIVAGFKNGINGIGSSVLGGTRNAAVQSYTSIVGGRDNTASNDGAVVVGGEGNSARGPDAVIVSGKSNNVTKDSAVIVGGQDNQVFAMRAVAIGGRNNRAAVDGIDSVILGGVENFTNTEETISPAPATKPLEWQ